MTTPAAIRGGAAVGRPTSARGEDGQTFPILIFAILGVILTGAVLMHGGRLTELRAEAATAADAAALAAADHIADTLEIRNVPNGVALGRFTSAITSLVLHERLPPWLEDEARDRARFYTAQNGGRDLQVRFDVRDRGARVFVIVDEVRTDRTFSRPAPSDAAAATRGSASAVALAEFRLVNDGGNRCATVAGVTAKIGRAPALGASSGLVDCGIGGSPVNTRDLAPAMMDAVDKLEEELGAPVPINEGYRSFLRQLQLYIELKSQDPNAVVAPPGNSQHERGLAIDTSAYPQVQVLVPGPAGNAEIGLCQFDPVTDAVHFSVKPGRECGGPNPPGTPPSLGDGGYEARDPFLVDASRLQ